jgi:hypothetical protein
VLYLRGLKIKKCQVRDAHTAHDGNHLMIEMTRKILAVAEYLQYIVV